MPSNFPDINEPRPPRIGPIPPWERLVDEASKISHTDYDLGIAIFMLARLINAKNFSLTDWKKFVEHEEHI